MWATHVYDTQNDIPSPQCLIAEVDGLLCLQYMSNMVTQLRILSLGKNGMHTRLRVRVSISEKRQKMECAREKRMVDLRTFSYGYRANTGKQKLAFSRLTDLDSWLVSDNSELLKSSAVGDSSGMRIPAVSDN